MAFYRDKASVFRCTEVSTEFERGVTHVGRVLHELNIGDWCANSRCPVDA